jgi:methylenetetrahydrofolate--tRNA-(uracil-5-)-methyltransferase
MIPSVVDNKLTIIGGGLAGCEAAWQAAQRGVDICLYEMRPALMTPAHRTGNLAELVCSNSFGSDQPDRAAGVLKAELRLMGCMLLDCAEATSLPAGGALAVDRMLFSQKVTEKIIRHPRVTLIRQEIPEIPSPPVIISTGPLTSNLLAQSLKSITGEEGLFFFDAIAPIVSHESINMEIAFRGSRYQFEEDMPGDYINCPLNQEQYEAFVSEILVASKVDLGNDVQVGNQGVCAGSHRYFEGCLPIEVIAGRGRDALAYGPMRPVGLHDPRTGRGPYAVVQLRQDNQAGSLYNMVGFQTNLTYTEQRRIFRMIPGLENVEFVRLGQMHRNTFINSPSLLEKDLQLRQYSGIFCAGQITGVEGYIGSIASGLLAGVNASRWVRRMPLVTLPPTTMLGALCKYITSASPADFQPMKASFGLLPPIEPFIRDKRARNKAYAERALMDLDQTLNTIYER